MAEVVKPTYAVPSEQFLQNYIIRVLPKLPPPYCGADSAASWARRIGDKESPVDVAREDVIEFWKLAEPLLLLVPSDRDPLLADLKESWMAGEKEGVQERLIALSLDDSLDERPETTTPHMIGPIGYQHSPESQSILDKLIDDFKPRWNFVEHGDRIDIDIVRQNAKIKLRRSHAPVTEPTESLKAKGRKIFDSAYLDEARQVWSKNKTYGKQDDEQPDPGDIILKTLIAAERQAESEAFLYFWVKETELEFHKVLAFFWITLGLSRQWVYTERQFALRLRESTDMVEEHLEPEVLRSAIKELSESRITNKDVQHDWLIDKTYEEVIWNDLVAGDGSNTSISPGKQFNDWVSVARKNAQSIIRSSWDQKISLLAELKGATIIEKLCYILTKGSKRTVRAFVGQLGNKPISALVTDTADAGIEWLKRDIELAMARQEIDHTTSLYEYFTFTSLSVDAAKEALEARLNSRVNSIHRELVIAALQAKGWGLGQHDA